MLPSFESLINEPSEEASQSIELRYVQAWTHEMKGWNPYLSKQELYYELYHLY